VISASGTEQGLQWRTICPGIEPDPTLTPLSTPTLTQTITDARGPQAVKAAAPASGKIRSITMEEVEKHSTKESVWFVRDGKARLSAPAHLLRWTARRLLHCCRCRVILLISNAPRDGQALTGVDDAEVAWVYPHSQMCCGGLHETLVPVRCGAQHSVLSLPGRPLNGN